ncbi:uncharacterized protein F4822DRAFT_402952 [Hypoxylon trugodes]|uniref:uncharacterized protein n=1 Tax=Hypoxylon trugodes TaxID=326681 RepID=UPI00218EF8AD|nr:uncharacterized protein F4822DRAFT_402952 [Hypoxylon trugodes]KAI1388477.1 hypothetical protein F4822DRAFT_402952 [Hypoxylon trugodes]
MHAKHTFFLLIAVFLFFSFLIFQLQSSIRPIHVLGILYYFYPCKVRILSYVSV